MIKTLEVTREELIDQIQDAINDIIVDEKILIDIDEKIISDLTTREVHIFAQKAAVLKLIAQIQEDL